MGGQKKGDEKELFVVELNQVQVADEDYWRKWAMDVKKLIDMVREEINFVRRCLSKLEEDLDRLEEKVNEKAGKAPQKDDED